MTRPQAIVVGLLLLPVRATAQPADSGPGQAKVFALAVGNNRSLNQLRPDLRYADDDAVKYGQVLRAFSQAPDVEVLTRPDAETLATLQPASLITGLPLKSDLFAAAQRLRSRVQAARSSGARTVFYFLFAGHGDQRGGKGYLELEDDRLGREDLLRLVETVGADRTHIVLDSCNSFFIIHPRRPGGKVWATVRDVGDDFAVAGSEIGIFLSTSAEAQVFEWSQLQSGVFSHAVRSGMLGIADANRDGRITYDELEGFVAIAAGDVSNSLYRPQLYVKPASSDGVFLDVAAPDRPAVELAGFENRVTLRDDHGVRWADAYPEADYTPELILPMDQGGSIVAELATPAAGRRLLYERAVERAERLTPALMAAATESPRGSDALFGQVFARPFGPRALAEHKRQLDDTPEQIYGLTRAQEERFGTHLRLLADNRKRTRMQLTGLALSVSGALAVTGLALLISDAAGGELAPYFKDPRAESTPRSVTVAEIAFAGSVLEVLAAGLFFLRVSDEENIYRDYVDQEPRTEQDRMRRVTKAYDSLSEFSQDRTSSRQLIAWTGPVIGAVASLAGVAILVFPAFVDPAGVAKDAVESTQIIGGVLAGLGVGLVGLGLVTPRFGTETEAEIIFDVVEQDPETVADVVR